jgi:hypothetical protein
MINPQIDTSIAALNYGRVMAKSLYAPKVLDVTTVVLDKVNYHTIGSVQSYGIQRCQIDACSFFTVMPHTFAYYKYRYILAFCNAGPCVAAYIHSKWER